MSRWSETPTDWLSRGDKKHNNKTTKDNDLTASKVTSFEHYPSLPLLPDLQSKFLRMAKECIG